MYESPIEVFYGQMQMDFENNVMQAIQKYDIKVNKDALVSALMYDRHQYEKGYADAKAESNWIPVEVGLPKLRGDYLVTFEDGSVQCNWFNTDINTFTVYHEAVVAWMEKPKGYRGSK